MSEIESVCSVVIVGLVKRSIRLLLYSFLCTSIPTLAIVWSFWTPVVFPFHLVVFNAFKIFNHGYHWPFKSSLRLICTMTKFMTSLGLVYHT